MNREGSRAITLFEDLTGYFMIPKFCINIFIHNKMKTRMVNESTGKKCIISPVFSSDMHFSNFFFCFLFLKKCRNAKKSSLTVVINILNVESAFINYTISKIIL